MDDDTNLEIAKLILKQTYEERVELAAYLASIAGEAVAEGADTDVTLFAIALASWADGEVDNAEASE